jgi:hypothetical protein
MIVCFEQIHFRLLGHLQVTGSGFRRARAPEEGLQTPERPSGYAELQVTPRFVAPFGRCFIFS